MDVSTCLKSLLLAVQQHCSVQSVHTEAQLLHRLQETSSLDGGVLLCPDPVLAAQCVGGLLEVAKNPACSSTLTGSILALLALLAGDGSSRENLPINLELSGTLFSIIQRSAPQEPVVLQCLQLLQRLTYSGAVLPSSASVPRLLSFLVTNIQSEDDVLLVPCLGLMANLCRENFWVQNQVRSLDQVKAFYRTLLNLLDHSSLTVVVFCLCILARLTLGDTVGDKLFGAENIQQTFQLVFNILVNGDGTLTRIYSVDLLVDLLRNHKTAQCLERYQHFSACVSQVLGLLPSKDPQSAAKVLELLRALCRVSGLRPLLCQVVFRPAGAKTRPAGRRAGPEGQDQGGCGGLVLLQMLSWPPESQSCSLQVLELLKELLEEALDRDQVSSWTLGFVNLLVPVLLDLLRNFSSSQDPEPRRFCSWISHISSLLLLLSSQEPHRSPLCRQLSAPLCFSTLQLLLSCCRSNGAPVTHGDLSVCSEAVVQVLDLMSRLRQQVEDMETTFYRTLQDHRMVTPLSLALTSSHKESVHRALSLLSEAAALPEFPLALLGDSIAANTSYRHREAGLSIKPGTLHQVPPPKNQNHHSSSTETLSCLAENLQTGLELKDRHVSEIIDVYEQKLSACSSKEADLQDLLDSKAAALSQADRVISQYRVQRAQAEAEARRLAALLKEAERRGEVLQAELSRQLEVLERSRSDTEELLRHNARLQEQSLELQELKGSYNTLLTRKSDGERRLEELQQQHDTLRSNNDTLRRNQETLQRKHRRLEEVLQQKEEENQNLCSDLQKKTAGISELQAELAAEEQQVKQKEAEQRELQENLDLLRNQLHKTEQARKEASIKASSLELQKSQLESKLQQKDEELNKHSAMIAMIHSLSSGRTRAEANLAL